MTRQIDRSRARDRYRFTCPAGHSSWEPTNSHGWCRTCYSDGSGGAHWHLRDQKTDELIPFSDVEVI